MRVLHQRLAATCLVLLTALGADKPLAGPSPGSGIAQTSLASDMPSFDEADYVSYEKQGASTLIVAPSFTLADGSKQFCSGRYDRAFVYPATAFTRWLIENWIYQLQKTKHMAFSTAFPGAYVRGLPTYLNRIKNDTVARETACNAEHKFVFTNLPVGYYLLYIERDNLVRSSHQKVVGQQVMTPDGPTFNVGDGGVYDNSYFSDGTVFYGEFTVHIDASGYDFTADPKAIQEVAHFAN